MSFSDLVGRLEADDALPLYLQLQRVLRSAIQGRVLQHDAAIPAERDLAEEYAVSRITVRKALSGLVDEGLLSRHRGAGTFVTSRVEKSFSRLSSFSEDMVSRGRRPHSVWINRSLGAVTPEEALSLGLSPGAAVYRFHRIRYADDAPMALEYATIPAYCLPSIEAVGDSLYEALAQSGYRPVRALQRLRAIALTKAQADSLGVAARDAGLLIERRGFLPDGRAAEFSQSYYRGDAYDVVAELSSGQ
ncbi:MULTISPECIES: GntR family transcriptional regulator [unclassified Caulobacter]|uniref:GntR family transcriptional regulator n=1 Tax=unclassified Caulobacter TaxID=2648921 RepID=UPI0006FC74EF|nr:MULTISPECIES: GntR family transcriptional regulator [unclassified Caulobacter]KQV57017.1 GntR family transcriptional regulator [Caulobacter sp. Root342]KQV66503.1 GntR family transcriptional regulator [Caulobacter sp. Root343]